MAGWLGLNKCMQQAILESRSDYLLGPSVHFAV